MNTEYNLTKVRKFLKNEIQKEASQRNISFEQVINPISSNRRKANKILAKVSELSILTSADYMELYFGVDPSRIYNIKKHTRAAIIS